MSLPKDPAYILLARTVHYDHGDLSFLASRTETLSISQVLEEAENVGCCQLVIEGVSHQHGIIDILNKHKSTPISIVHIMGSPANISYADQQEIAKLLGQYSQLKIVFLSGCASLSLIKWLLLKDIPAVIATQASSSEEEIQQAAQLFYESLNAGNPTKAAIDRVCEQFDMFTYHRAHYEFEYDQLKWETLIEENASTQIPWGLYILTDHLSELNWRFPYTERLSAAQAEEKTQEEVVPKKISLPIVGAILAVLMAVGGFLFYQNWQQEGIPQTDCPFEAKGNGANVLVLPVWDRDIDQMDLDIYTPILKTNLKEFTNRSDIHTHYKEIQNPRNISVAIDKYVLGCDTDVLLSTSYRNMKHIGDDYYHFEINFILPHVRGDSLLQGSVGSTVKINPNDNFQFTLINTIRDLFYSALGHAFYEQELYHQALSMFHEVNVNNDSLYAYVALKMAQSYASLEILDTAESYYDHVIKINPSWDIPYNGRANILVKDERYEDAISNYQVAITLNKTFTEAYYNRGLVYYKLEAYEDARSDMQHVLSIDDKNAEAYGMLAAIAAVERDEEMMYHYLDQALQLGIDLKQFLAHTDLSHFQAETRFRELTRKYNPSY